jgi:hypothetical protein
MDFDYIHRMIGERSLPTHFYLMPRHPFYDDASAEFGGNPEWTGSVTQEWFLDKLAAYEAAREPKGDPDYNAVSSREAYERAWEDKRRNR